MNQCWRVKDTIRAEWRKDSQTASSLIFFVIDTASWFAFRLQQERMGSHVHRASRCRNLIKKKIPSKWTPFLPHCSSFSPSSFCFLGVPSFPLFLYSMPSYPHFKTEAHTVNITVCGTWLSHRWLWEKKKKLHISPFKLAWISFRQKLSIFLEKKTKHKQSKLEVAVS